MGKSKLYSRCLLCDARNCKLEEPAKELAEELAEELEEKQKYKHDCAVVWRMQKRTALSGLLNEFSGSSKRK